MTLRETREVAERFLRYRYTEAGTERGFDEWTASLEERIIEDLGTLEKGQGRYKWAISKRTGVPTGLLTLLLKKLRHEGKVQIIRLFDERDGKVAGSGYRLTENHGPKN